MMESKLTRRDFLGTGVVGVGALGLGFLATPDLWRVGFYILGIFSILSGVAVWFLVDEPIRGAAEPELEGIITEENAAKCNEVAEKIHPLGISLEAEEGEIGAAEALADPNIEDNIANCNI